MNDRGAYNIIDLFDNACRVYQNHFLSLFSITACVFGVSFILQVVLIDIIGYWWSVIIVMPISFYFTTIFIMPRIANITHPLTDYTTQAYHPTIRQYVGVAGIYLVYFFLLILPRTVIFIFQGLLEIERINYHYPRGSADTPLEQTFTYLFIIFWAVYPFIFFFMTSVFQFYVTIVMFKRAGMLLSFFRSLHIARRLGRTVFVATLLRMGTYLITLLPLLTLWYYLYGSSDTAGFTTGQIILSAFIYLGIALALPIGSVLQILLYYRAHLNS